MVWRSPLVRQRGKPVAPKGLETLLDQLKPRDYFALLAYLPPDDKRFASLLIQIRNTVALNHHCATMLGYGPRYLHSTGQLHKGGANNGVFLIVTAPADNDLPVPDAPYSFGVLEMAQALGDFQSLDRANRRAAHVHLPDSKPGFDGHIGESARNSTGNRLKITKLPGCILCILLPWQRSQFMTSWREPTRRSNAGEEPTRSSSCRRCCAPAP
jgi:hypothetical protein